MTPSELAILNRAYLVIERFTEVGGCVFCSATTMESHKDGCEAIAVEEEIKELVNDYRSALHS